MRVRGWCRYEGAGHHICLSFFSFLAPESSAFFPLLFQRRSEYLSGFNTPWVIFFLQYLWSVPLIGAHTFKMAPGRTYMFWRSVLICLANTDLVQVSVQLHSCVWAAGSIIIHALLLRYLVDFTNQCLGVVSFKNTKNAQRKIWHRKNVVKEVSNDCRVV